MEVSTLRRYLSILERRVGREMPRSLAARLRLPPVRSRASLMSRLAKCNRVLYVEQPMSPLSFFTYS